MNNFLLTPHFELKEFTENATAREHRIDNEPSFDAIENLKALCVFTLEPLREALGLPIIITNGYRCKELNDLLASHSTKSMHMEGQAADFYVRWNGPKEDIPLRRELLITAFRLIITDGNINFDSCIIYPSYIHVSYVRSGRDNCRMLSCGFSDGTYVGLNYDQAIALV